MVASILSVVQVDFPHDMMCEPFYPGGQDTTTKRTTTSTTPRTTTNTAPPTNVPTTTTTPAGGGGDCGDIFNIEVELFLLLSFIFVLKF